MRQGFQPLSDYWFYLKLTPMGIAVSSVAFEKSIVIYYCSVFDKRSRENVAASDT
jgi:hypothetical protein